MSDRPSDHARVYGKTRVARLPDNGFVTSNCGAMRARGTRLLCSDGKIRAPSRLAPYPDTFFSTSCAMRIKGKTVTGYMTVEEACVPPAYHVTRRAFVFRRHVNTETSHLLPDWPGDKFTQEAFDLLKDGEEITDGK